MATRLGKDCKVYIATEHLNSGFTALGAMGTASLVIPPLTSLTASATAAIGDIIGIDIPYGQSTIDFPIYGAATNVRGVTRDEVELSITRLRDGELFRDLHYSASWGVTGSTPVIDDGTGDIRTDSGFRILFIEGQTHSNASVPTDAFTVYSHCQVANYAQTKTVDGTTQETITFACADWYTPANAAAITAARTIT
jgi:hypothetical protein